MNFFTPRLWQWKHKNICLLVAYTQKLYCAEWQQRKVKNVQKEKNLWESLTTWGIFFTDKLQWSFMKKKNPTQLYNLELTFLLLKRRYFLYFIYYCKWDTLCIFRQLENNNITRVTQSWLYGLKGLREMWVKFIKKLNTIFVKKKRGGGMKYLNLIRKSPTYFNEDSKKELEESWTAYGNCLQWWGMFTGNNTGPSC